MISRTFKLCLNAGNGSAPYINVNQYDEGETWLFELYSENGERYIPSSGAIVGVKSDGHGIVNTGTVDSEGRVVITETQQMTASAGRAIYELSIDGLTHGTANFIVAVERKPTDDAVMSDSDLSLIQQAVDSAEVIVEVIGDGDPSEVIGEHVDAWLDNHPEATTTVEDGAITAPKINNSLWDKLLVSESASGNPASFDDGADDIPVSSLKVALEPIQTGTGDPSPSNIRPIIAANGVNVWDEEWEVGGLASGVPNPSTNQIRSKNYCACLGNTAYYLHTSKTDGGSQNKYYISIHWYDDNKNFISFAFSNNDSTVSPSNAAYFKISTNSSTVVYGATYNHDISINYPSTYTAYQPYQGIMVEKTGKNLWKFNNSYTLNAAGSWLTVDASRSFPLKAGTYTWSFNALQAIDTIQMYFRTANDVSKTVSFYVGTSTGTGRKSYTFTLDEDVAILRSAYCNGAMSIEDIQIELGSESTDYEPYTFTSYPISLGREVYGGTLDVSTGVLTVDMKKITLTADMNWQYSSATDRFFVVINDAVAKSGDLLFAGMCNMFKSATGNDDNSVSYINQSANGFAIKHSVLGGSLTAWKQFITNNTVEVVYKLATPQTINLTPQEVKTLLGYNNISSTGTVDVIYHADTKLYVDKMTNVDNAIIAPTEADFVATRNYTVNDLVIVNDTLYKVTANIASGSAITPNSNVQQTTLGALIKALS